MGCWAFLILTVPAFYFAARCATDFSPDPPRYWHRPSSYAFFFLFAALIWVVGWFAPALWRYHNAFDRQDLQQAAALGEELLTRLPAGLGVSAFALGIYLAATARALAGNRAYCRHCGYERAGPGRFLTPRCPECGRRWSWFGDAMIGSPVFNSCKAAWGAVLAFLGLCAIALQFYK